MPHFANEVEFRKFDEDTRGKIIDILVSNPPVPTTEFRPTTVSDKDGRPFEFGLVRQRTPDERATKPGGKWVQAGQVAGISTEDWHHILRTSPNPFDAARRVIDLIFNGIPASQDPSALELRRTIEATVQAAIAKRIPELGLMTPEKVDSLIAEAVSKATAAGDEKVKEIVARENAVPQGVQPKAKGIKKMDAIEKETAKQETRLQYRQLVDANWKSAKGVAMSKTPEPAEASKSGWWFALVKREATRFQQHQLNEATRTAEIEAEQKEAAEEAVAKAHFTEAK